MPRPSPKNVTVPDLIADIVTEVMGTNKEIECEPTKSQKMALGRWNKENGLLKIHSITIIKRNGEHQPKETKKFKKNTFMKF